jgi:transposase
MDNYSIHRNPRVEEMCALRGVTVEYLLPYCPMFNPIEESFKDLKAAIRRHYKNKGADYDGFQLFLEQIIQEMGHREDARKRARGHFKNC